MKNLDRSDVYNMKMDIEGVLFDYGHTLAYLPNVERTHKLAAMNVQRLVKDIDGVKAETSRITELINDYAHGPKDVVSIQDEFSQILRMLGVQRFHNENLEEIIRAHAVPYIQRARIRSGAKDLLILLKRNGAKTGIVANSAGAYMMNPVLKRERIFQFFDSIVPSVGVGFRKPDPRIFHLALGQLQLNHNNVLMVGDNPRNDVKGAHDIGMHTARFLRGPNRTKPDLVKPDLKIRNFSTLAPYLGILRES